MGIQASWMHKPSINQLITISQGLGISLKSLNHGTNMEVSCPQIIPIFRGFSMNETSYGGLPHFWKPENSSGWVQPKLQCRQCPPLVIWHSVFTARRFLDVSMVMRTITRIYTKFFPGDVNLRWSKWSKWSKQNTQSPKNHGMIMVGIKVKPRNLGELTHRTNFAPTKKWWEFLQKNRPPTEFISVVHTKP